MEMLGNDIVDLALAKIQSNWKRKGYLQKIFTMEEQELIHSSTDPDQTVWLLWSMKEAAYKIHSRKTGIREYAPLKLVCTFNSSSGAGCGTVAIDGDLYFTKSCMLTDYIHTWAAATPCVRIKIAIYSYPDHEFDYKATHPACISHHGKYLALVY